MTRRAFDKRRARIAEGCCPRCGKPVDPWPLQRADLCHTAGAVVCGRHWHDILAAESRLTIKESD